MAALSRKISVTLVDLLQMIQIKLKEAGALTSRVHEMIIAGGWPSPSPLRIYPVSQIEEALRSFQGRVSGKIVLSFGMEDKVKVALRSPEPKELNPNGTYVVAGGQGGLGRVICSWMAQIGAKYIVVLSRSGPENASTRQLAHDLAQIGTTLQAFAYDVSNGDQLSAVLKDCRQNLPPIRGVIQAALQLKDTVFERMTSDDYARVLAPKVQGTHLLHEATRDEALDFFLILSSYAGLVGNPGQANYAAASAYQDAFARWRTSNGRSTRSINLGPVEGAGYLHENPGALKNLQNSGLEALPSENLLALLRYAISQPFDSVSDSQLAIGCKMGVNENPVFAYLQHRGAESPIAQGPGKENEKASPEELLREVFVGNLAADEASSRIQIAISHYVSTLLGVPLDDVDVRNSIVAHGGDSLVVVEFRNWLRMALGNKFGQGKDLGRIALRELAGLAADNIRASALG